MSAAQRTCTCPHGERNLGRLHGVSMGRGIVRLDTTPGCPEHDTCHGYTAAFRAVNERGSAYWCPIHAARNCPEGTSDA